MIQMRTLKKTARADRGGGLVEAHPLGITEYPEQKFYKKRPSLMWFTQKQTDSLRRKRMTSVNKNRKAHRTLLDRGGEKGKAFRLKRECFYHKKERTLGKKECHSYDLD